MPPIDGPAAATRASGAPLTSTIALVLLGASGFAALGYQIIWTHQCTLWLGHETAGVLAVVGAFFGGLAIGALALGARIARSAHPARWFAACEAVTGLWGIALAAWLAPVSQWLLELTGAQAAPGRQWAVAFVGTLLLLLPATAAMGATLPAMERVFAPLRRGGTFLGALYAANTAGAVAGVLAVAFWLVPRIGLTRAAAVCVLLNLTCAALTWWLARGRVERRAAEVLAAHDRRKHLVALAATGLFGIGYEVLVVRVLSQVAENTVYTFAMLLAMYLVGTALGAAAYQRWLAARPDGGVWRDRLLWALAGSCLFGTLSLWGAEAVKRAVVRTLGEGMGSALAGEAAIALLAFLPPTFVMGAVFSHLCTRALASGVALGHSLAANTIGAALAPLLFGVLLVPLIGTKTALLIVAAGYLLLVSRRAWRTPLPWVASGATAVLAAWTPALTFIDVPDAGRVLSHREGAMAAVSVVEDAQGVARLHINNRQQEGSSATRVADARQALLPMLLHPAPRRALLLGLGTGVTAASAAEDPTLQVDVAELLPEVIAASRHFTAALAADGHEPRMNVVAADARRFVRATDQRYDLIVSDNFHPARSGSGSLYTVEHFQAVRARLAAGGLFCQWLPLHQLDLSTVRSIVRSFTAVYPQAWAMLATHSLDTPVLGLVAPADALWRLDPARIGARLRSVALPQSPAAFGIGDELALLGGFVAGPASLAAFAAGAAPNTDDHPVVAYRAPHVTYAPDSLPRERLVALLRELELSPDELVQPAADPAWPRRLAAYWRARDAYLEAGVSVRPSADVRDMLRQVRAPLLEALRISPDFTPAYDPLLRMATALGGIDAAAARMLLDELIRVQPARREAAEALARLGP